MLERLGVDTRQLGQAPESSITSAGPTGITPASWPQLSPGLVSQAVAPEFPSAANPDANLYAPLFSPWRGLGDFNDYLALARPYTLVSADRCYVLLTLVRQALSLKADFVECGVYKGGTAMLIAKAIAASRSDTRLCLFDTFEGMPATDPSRDLHKAGDFADTSRSDVEARVVAIPGVRPDRIALFPGWIPATFNDARLERVALAHIDVDIHRSVIDCCEHLYPRVVDGGFMVFDDYGFPSCPGARMAVDEFFRDKPECPLVLPTGQAVIFRHRMT
ncbi:MAG: TylF/MycF/NovP-related O-methyltransferase [Casimicrobiaceae bacterium]